MSDQPPSVSDQPPAPRPVRVLQFGTGNFLRAFADQMIQRANDAGVTDLQIVIVQSTDRPSPELTALREQGGRFHVLLEGIRDGQRVREITPVTCVREVLSANADFAAYRAAYLDPDLAIVLSNTTEAGIVWDPEDDLTARPPRSFPGKVTALLYERYRQFAGAPEAGLAFVCCELIEDNATTLRELVLRHADAAELGGDFARWVREANTFHDSLVDRIVPGYPAAEAAALAQELGGADRAAVKGELFGLWAIAGPARIRDLLPLDRAGLPVTFVPDLEDVRERKVRVLNGLHTALTQVGLALGLDTVREAQAHPLLGRYLEELLAAEILPSLPGEQSELRAYAAATRERFANPSLEHRLADIALNSSAKAAVRILPAVRAAWARGDEAPASTFALAALLLLLAGQAGPRVPAAWEPRDAPGLATALRDTFDPAEVSAWASGAVRRAGWFAPEAEGQVELADRLASEIAAHAAAITDLGVERALANLLGREPSSQVASPAVRPTQVGIVHLGWGAFHRAHQAVYTQDAMAAAGDLRWGILADVQRKVDLVDVVRGQGGCYTVLAVGVDEAGRATESARVVGSLVDVAARPRDTPRLLAAIAAPSTHVVTLTVTEKGYLRRPDGSVDLAQAGADVAALAREEAGGNHDDDAPGTAPEPAVSAMGLLVRGLAARRRAGGAPITVLSCDNMPENGEVLREVVDQLVDAALPGEAGAALRAWLTESVTFPSSMVDRITPATTPELLDRVAELRGVRDEVAVSAEPFMQWVIEDDFAGPRPPWELAGADIVADVRPWELAKLRLLNGTHSLLAYAGRLAGHASIAAAVSDPELLAAARTYMFEDALATLTPPAGADLPAYAEELLRRFANPATGHSTRQVSTDGSQKIPIRWGGVAAENLAAGRVPAGVAFGLAAWSEFVRRAVRDGVDLGDPGGAERLRAAVHDSPGGGSDPAATARALIALPGLLPAGVGVDPGLAAAVASRAEALSASSSTIDATTTTITETP